MFSRIFGVRKYLETKKTLQAIHRAHQKTLVQFLYYFVKNGNAQLTENSSSNRELLFANLLLRECVPILRRIYTHTYYFYNILGQILGGIYPSPQWIIYQFNIQGDPKLASPLL